jgi:hypothetical protein
LVLSQEVDQHHHDHPGQGIVKWCDGVHGGISSKWGGGWWWITWPPLWTQPKRA